ncbi:MAG: class I SAM-dependent methyltransferase [Planctomycetota bacterium]
MTTCPACTSTRRTRITSRGKDFVGQEIVGCLDCGGLYQSPRLDPDELAAYYRSEYSLRYRGAATPDAAAIALRDRVAQYRFDRLRRHGLLLPGETLLEIGCGAGNFLRLCRSGGMLACGIEPSAGYAEHARADGLDVQVGMFPDCRGSSSHYDAVALFHVLEHLPDPAATLTAVRELLSPHASVAVEIPEWGRALGPRWSERYFHAPHLVDFTRASLRCLLERTGYVVTLEDFGPAPDRRHHLLVVARPTPAPVAPTPLASSAIHRQFRRLRAWIAISRITGPAFRGVRSLTAASGP